MKRPRNITRSVWIALSTCVTMTCVPSTSAYAQSPVSIATAPDSALPTRSCFRGRARPHCESFWLTEFGVAVPISGAKYTDGGRLFTWELGGMKNVGRHFALGAAGFADGGMPSSGIGFRPRARLWLADGNSLEIAPGIVLAGPATGPAFSGHVAFNMSDYLAFTVHVVTVKEPVFSPSPNPPFTIVGQKTHPVVFAGGRLGSKPGTITGILFPALTVAAFFAVCSSGGCS